MGDLDGEDTVFNLHPRVFAKSCRLTGGQALPTGCLSPVAGLSLSHDARG